MKKIILIESSDIGVRYSAEAVRNLGFEPLFLCDMSGYQADPKAQILSCAHFHCDTSSSQSILKFIADNNIQDIEAVITLADSRLKIAVEVAGALGVRGVDPAVARLKDKFWVVDLIPEYSPSSVTFGANSIPVPELKALFEESPAVFFKPLSGAGALGTFKLESRAEIKTLKQKIASLDIPSYMGNGDWIAQPFYDGKLISVEGYAHAGKVHILGFSDRKKIGSTESAARFPIDISLPIRTREKATRSIRDLVRKSKFQNGYFHIEFLVSDTFVVLIDANMGRVGGGAIAEQLAIAYGVQPVQVFQHLIQLTLFPERLNGSSPELYRERAQETYAIFYGLDQEEWIESVIVPSGIPCFHTQILGSGSKVSAMGTNDWAWIGIISGKVSDTMESIDKIKILTRTGERQPCF
ncbi:MAG: ATP-grasp domain-containing protein [Bdellovibrionales bacterium]|nr:ATP-grasp domain-containing protein [Bdellovibrionales bacterium]